MAAGQGFTSSRQVMVEYANHVTDANGFFIAATLTSTGQLIPEFQLYIDRVVLPEAMQGNIGIDYVHRAIEQLTDARESLGEEQLKQQDQIDAQIQKLLDATESPAFVNRPETPGSPRSPRLQGTARPAVDPTVVLQQLRVLGGLFLGEQRTAAGELTQDFRAYVVDIMRAAPDVAAEGDRMDLVDRAIRVLTEARQALGGVQTLSEQQLVQSDIIDMHLLQLTDAASTAPVDEEPPSPQIGTGHRGYGAVNPYVNPDSPRYEPVTPTRNAAVPTQVRYGTAQNGSFLAFHPSPLEYQGSASTFGSGTGTRESEAHQGRSTLPRFPSPLANASGGPSGERDRSSRQQQPHAGSLVRTCGPTAGSHGFVMNGTGREYHSLPRRTPTERQRRGTMIAATRIGSTQDHPHTRGRRAAGAPPTRHGASAEAPLALRHAALTRREEHLNERMANLSYRENELAAREAQLARRMDGNYGQNGGIGRVGRLRREEFPTPGMKRRRVVAASASVPRDFYDRVDFGNVLSTTTPVPGNIAHLRRRANPIDRFTGEQVEAGAIENEDSNDEGSPLPPAKRRRRALVRPDSPTQEDPTLSRPPGFTNLFGMTDRGRTIFPDLPSRPTSAEGVEPAGRGNPSM